MKTNLARILSVSGQHGLYRYIAQSRSGAIAENLENGQRTVFGGNSRITSLADIAIYTSEGELKLKEVFEAMSKTLGGKEAPGPKAPEADIKALFSKAVPKYDGERFYVSHMKKIVTWYNELLKHASLEFTEEDSEESEKDS